MSDSLVWRLIMRDNSEPAASSFRKTLEKVRGDTERHANAFAKAGSVTEGFTRTLVHGSAAIGTASTALVNGAGAAVAFAHSAAVASGALLLIPGAVAAGGVAMAAFKVGTSGVADAMALAADGGDEYRKALKNLAPEQAKFVKSAVAQKGAWADVRKEVGGRLFQDMSVGVELLANKYLPLVKSGLGDVADNLNEAAFQMGEWALQNDTAAKFNNIMHDSADIIGGVTKAARPLANALLNIFSASTYALTNYTGGFQKFANRFDDFIYKITDNGQGGQFAVWIENGVKEIHRLSDGVGSLVTKASDPAFKAAVITVWQGFQKSAAAVNKELPLVVQAVTDLAPAFSDVIAAGGGSFGATLHTVATAAIALAPTINAVAHALLPLAPLLGAVAPYLFLAAKGMQAWAVVGPIVKAVRLWTAAQGGLNVVLAANPIGLIVIALGLLVIGLVIAYKKSETFRTIVNAVFKSVADAVLDMVSDAIGAFAKMFEVLGHLPGKAGSAFRSLAKSARNAQGEINDLRKDLSGIKSKWITIHVQTAVRTAGNAAIAGAIAATIAQAAGNARADGGPVRKGETYVVGERQPELFVPTQDGVILPRVPDTTSGGRAWGSGGGGVHITVVVQGSTLASQREIREAVTEAWHAAPAGAKALPARAVGPR